MHAVDGVHDAVEYFVQYLRIQHTGVPLQKEEDANDVPEFPCGGLEAAVWAYIYVIYIYYYILYILYIYYTYILYICLRHPRWECRGMRSGTGNGWKRLPYDSRLTTHDSATINTCAGANCNRCDAHYGMISHSLTLKILRSSMGFSLAHSLTRSTLRQTCAFYHDTLYTLDLPYPLYPC